MQRILLICCLFTTTMLTSCGYYSYRERVALYHEITATNDTLNQMTREWHVLLNQAVKTKNFSPLNAYRISLGRYISRHRAKIADMELPSDAETLRESEGVFLSKRADVVTNIYPRFEAYNELTPDATVQRSLKQVANDLDNEYAWYLTIKKSADAFAKRNNLKEIK